MTVMEETAPEAHEDHHPTPKQYWLIALFLAVITGIEVAASYMDALGDWLIPILLVLAAVKFFAVVGWFMHLKFENVTMQRLFIAGLVLAITLFVVLLTIFSSLF